MLSALRIIRHTSFWFVILLLIYKNNSFLDTLFQCVLRYNFPDTFGLENQYMSHMGYQRLIKTRFRSLYNCFSSGKWKIRLGYRVCIHHQIYIIIYYMRYHTHTNRIVGSREKYIWYKKLIEYLRNKGNGSTLEIHLWSIPYIHRWS